MADPIKSSSRLKDLVTATMSEVTSDQIDNYAKLMEVERQDRKVTAVLKAWSDQEDHYRVARKKYADRIIVALLAQSGLVNIAFFLIGFSYLKIDIWVANSFILGVFSEMAALTLKGIVIHEDSTGLELRIVDRL